MLAHRGQHWTLLQNATRTLWNVAHTVLLRVRAEGTRAAGPDVDAEAEGEGQNVTMTSEMTRTRNARDEFTERVSLRRNWCILVAVFTLVQDALSVLIMDQQKERVLYVDDFKRLPCDSEVCSKFRPPIWPAKTAEYRARFLLLLPAAESTPAPGAAAAAALLDVPAVQALLWEPLHTAADCVLDMMVQLQQQDTDKVRTRGRVRWGCSRWVLLWEVLLHGAS